MKRWAIALAIALCSCAAWAHKSSDSYLILSTATGNFTGQWDIALRDLEYAVGLDQDGNGEITWGELRSRWAEIDAYAFGRLSIDADGRPCAIGPTERLVDEHSDGAYAVLRFEVRCAPKASILVAYRLLFDIDPTHRGLLRVDRPGGSTTAVLGPDAAPRQFELASASAWTQFADYLVEGVWHIWIGFDHILFLVSLLLPAVVVRNGGRWTPTPVFWPALVDVLKVVTSFTVAHSITLCLATLSIVELPSRIVESAIALSVILAAVNNVYPVVLGYRWLAAFGFGLIHGFGFASVLSDLGLPQDTLLLALVGFNVGVEAGQLAIVAAFLPFAYLARGTWLYQRLVFVGGSVMVAAVATVWFAQRAFNL